jgi:hypothetical protein
MPVPPSAIERDDRRVLLALQRSMTDPALSGGCALLAELFAALPDEPAAAPLLSATPHWKIPGLLLSAALVHQAAAAPQHPLARYLPGADAPLDAAFRDHLRRAIADDVPALASLLQRHTYQCNPPRRLAVSLLALAHATADWRGPKALHIDVGTASGIGLLLGQIGVVCGASRLGPDPAELELPLELRGARLDPGALAPPAIAQSIGIDLDPPDLRDRACRAWLRACQFPLAAEWDWFDRAIDLVLAQPRRIERGSATDWLPRLAAEMPPHQPLLVTDTYVAVFMSEDEREQLRRELDAIASQRPVAWVSNNPVVPLGEHPDRTTAGQPIPAELIERSHREMFGVVSATTWPHGVRTARTLAVTHPGGCWLEWRPDLAG